MGEHFDLVILGGRVVLPWGVEETAIGIRAGRIAALGVADNVDRGEALDARGLFVLPGLIDPHVHFRDPGDARIESIASGTRAAVLGGLAAVFDMPNTDPPITDAARLEEKQARAERSAWCDVGLYVGATKENAGALAALETRRGVCAVKVFAASSTGNLLVEDDASLAEIMRRGRRRIAYHSEDQFRLQARRGLFHTGEPYARHAEWRDEETAFLATRRLVALAESSARPAHFLHVSTAEEFAFLKEHRDIATCEALVAHLTEAAPDVYERLGPYAVVNPPIRAARHRAAAWAAVRDGTLDTIGSDHAPHSRAAKERPWPECAAGMTGVQTIVPLMLDHVSRGRLSLGRLVDLMCAGPARVYGVLGKGRIACGYDADFTLVDMGAERRIEAGWLVYPCGWSPFAGRRVKGWPIATIVRGRIVMREDSVLGEPSGRLVRFR